MPTHQVDERVFASLEVSRLLDLALEEDLGERGDVTSLAIPVGATCRGRVVYREGGVVCGLPLAERVLSRLDPSARFEAKVREGARVDPGTTAATIAGDARGVLAAERTLLNFLQRLGGVSTATARYVDAVGELPARVLDTRKTTPGYRLLEKYAVRLGGGENHRLGLYDMILLKDNHLAVLGGEGAVADAVARARAAAPEGIPLEIEVTTQQGAVKAARAGADIVLLDNFPLAALGRAVAAVRADARSRGEPAPLLEASGGITLDTIRAVAEAGVDRISTGWITHSAPALDVALDFEIELPE